MENLFAKSMEIMPLCESDNTAAYSSVIDSDRYYR